MIFIISKIYLNSVTGPNITVIGYWNVWIQIKNSISMLRAKNSIQHIFLKYERNAEADSCYQPNNNRLIKWCTYDVIGRTISCIVFMAVKFFYYSIGRRRGWGYNDFTSVFVD